ncbi:MAG TPA: type II toxin-antitoxin system HicA family toxin [Candidatus Hydrogenedentes bacterium]|nr:type II toxin-antitoxin system HicA family toxin [Candidatus Hydrogenedentota bacterium]HNT89831.1 type II toxin-antitoxin system HicA family toxin [Candidatus Hydrogenedentota bacterium]
MEKIPALTPRKVVAALKRAGFKERRQRGSHLLLCHSERHVTVIVPMHAGDLPRGTLRAIIREAGLTDAEFLDLL